MALATSAGGSHLKVVEQANDVEVVHAEENVLLVGGVLDLWNIESSKGQAIT